MAQPPGTARYYPYNGLETWTTTGYATASFSPSAMGVDQVYWFAMTVAFSGSNKFAVWDPQTDTGDELDIQFLNGDTHYVSASAEPGMWDLYTPDSIYPLMNIKFEVQNPGFQTYTISYSEPDTWLVDETFTGTSVSGVDYVMEALPAGLAYSVPIYVLCACTRYENPPGEVALELTCGKITLNSSGAEPMLMMMQMSVEESTGVLTSVRESAWWQKVVSLVFGGGYQRPLPPAPPPDEPPPAEPVDNGGNVDPVEPPAEPPPEDPVTPPVDDGSSGTGTIDPVEPTPSTDPGMDLVNSIIASGKVGAIYYADSGYNRMYQLMQFDSNSSYTTLGTSSIGPNLIQTAQGLYWYGVLEDRDNDGFFETIIYRPKENGMAGSVEAYPTELIGLYVTQAPPGTMVLEPNIFSITGNEGNMQISMHSIIGVADQYLAIIKTPNGYVVSEVPSDMFTTTPTI